VSANGENADKNCAALKADLDLCYATVLVPDKAKEIQRCLHAVQAPNGRYKGEKDCSKPLEAARRALRGWKF